MQFQRRAEAESDTTDVSHTFVYGGAAQSCWPELLIVTLKWMYLKHWASGHVTSCCVERMLFSVVRC